MAGSLRPRIHAVAGKGGEGKTLVSMNLAALLARRDLKVLYVDLDTGSGEKNANWDLETPWRLGDFFHNGVPLEKVIRRKEIPWAGSVVSLDVLPGSMEGVGADAKPDRLAAALVLRGYDHIVLDLGAGTKRPLFRFVRLAETLLVVTGTHPNALRESADILGAACVLVPEIDVEVLFNRMPADPDGSRKREAERAFTEALSKKTVVLEWGRNRFEGRLDRHLVGETKRLSFRDETLPVLPASAQKLRMPGEETSALGHLLGEIAREWTAKRSPRHPMQMIGQWMGGIREVVTGVLSRQSKDAGGQGGVLFWPGARALYDRARRQEALKKTLERCRVFSAAKGGSGQTELLAQLGKREHLEGPSLYWDLSVEETARQSSLGWYFGLRQPQAIRTMWDGDGHVWPLDRKLELDVFYYRSAQRTEGIGSFTEAFLSRLVESNRGEKYRWNAFDAESGPDPFVLFTAFLAGNLTLIGDATDGESEEKLVEYGRQLVAATEVLPLDDAAFRLRLVVNKTSPGSGGQSQSQKWTQALRKGLGKKFPAFSSSATAWVPWADVKGGQEDRALPEAALKAVRALVFG